MSTGQRGPKKGSLTACQKRRHMTKGGGKVPQRGRSGLPVKECIQPPGPVCDNSCHAEEGEKTMQFCQDVKAGDSQGNEEETRSNGMFVPGTPSDRKRKGGKGGIRQARGRNDATTVTATWGLDDHLGKSFRLSWGGYPATLSPSRLTGGRKTS